MLNALVYFYTNSSICIFTWNICYSRVQGARGAKKTRRSARNFAFAKWVCASVCMCVCAVRLCLKSACAPCTLGLVCPSRRANMYLGHARRTHQQRQMNAWHAMRVWFGRRGRSLLRVLARSCRAVAAVVAVVVVSIKMHIACF